MPLSKETKPMRLSMLQKASLLQQRQNLDHIKKINKKPNQHYFCIYLVFELFHFFQVFHTIFNWWSFTGVSDNKSPLVSWTLLRNPANLDSAVVSMISLLPMISNSSSLLSKPLRTVPSVPTTISITVTFLRVSQLLSSLARFKLSLLITGFVSFKMYAYIEITIILEIYLFSYIFNFIHFNFSISRGKRISTTLIPNLKVG